ncbi:hypothetical protein GWK47_055090 [Chionoecetes opilio]|uniref:Uncharacterized protein n=1 Tax=Chionoecetes opilio TaxID=41210 RepID=A0A8J4XZH2_CHIOP|nr:hypothetical protein GWK47_055090 [Chionoecetes opilio]
MGPEVDEGDVDELVEEHSKELTTEELQELETQQHTKVLQEIGTPEEPEAEEAISTNTLYWKRQNMTDNFLSTIDPSILNKFIINGYFMKEVAEPSEIVMYLFHKICCTANEELCSASYDTLSYMLYTCDALPYIKNEFFLALVNLGGDLSLLERDVMSYKSSVIPPQSLGAPALAQMTETQLVTVLHMLLRLLSQCFTRHKNYTCQDADELIVIFTAIALDPKTIDAALDYHIVACISHTLTLYSSDDHFSKRLKGVVRCLVQYCDGDLPSLVHLCQFYLSSTKRGAVLCSAVAFQQLRLNLKLPEEDFVGDVQVKHIADVLTGYFESGFKLTGAYDAYYLIKLIDLCLYLDNIRPHQREDLGRICDLIEERFPSTQGNADDMNPTISFQYRVSTLKKWKRYLVSLISENQF